MQSTPLVSQEFSPYQHSFLSRYLYTRYLGQVVSCNLDHSSPFLLFGTTVYLRGALGSRAASGVEHSVLTQAGQPSSPPPVWLGKGHHFCMINCVTLTWEMGHLLFPSPQPWQAEDKQEGVAGLEWGVAMSLSCVTHMLRLQHLLPIPRVVVSRSLQKTNCFLSK